MNKRFIWNFEVNLESSLQFPQTSTIKSEEMYWESRAFWPHSEIITLNKLSDIFLRLSHYQVKLKEDSYYILPNLQYNLKLRKNNLLYKPLITKTPIAIAFGNKINLNEQKADSYLPGIEDLDTKTLIKKIHQESKLVHVEKEALIYQFNTTPTAKLELARLTFNHTVHFTLSIESSSYALVQSITEQILGECHAHDYVSYLQLHL